MEIILNYVSYMKNKIEKKTDSYLNLLIKLPPSDNPTPKGTYKPSLTRIKELEIAFKNKVDHKK